jgi:predicted nucleotidyltransferase
VVTDLKTVMPLVQRYIADVKKAMPIDKVYLFGSFAKGTQSEWSDVDLCFFSSSFVDTHESGYQLLLLAHNSLDTVVIEPHCFPTSELDNDNPFVKEILRTGREL